MQGSIGGQNDWRVQPDTTLQVVNPKTPQRKSLVKDEEEPRQNYRGILIAWLIIFVVLLAVVISVAIIGVREPRHVLIGRRLNVEDVLLTDYRSRPFSATWRGDSFIYKDSTRNLVHFNITTSQSKILFQLEDPLWHMDACISPDGKYVLERKNIKFGLRGSSDAQYTIHDVVTGRQFPVLMSRDSLREPRLQVAVFAPSPGAGAQVALVHAGDVYLLSSVETQHVRRVTTSAAETLRLLGRSAVLNGVTSWWYRETLFKTSQAMWFSPSGSHLMFVTFNDSLVDTFHTLQHDRSGETVVRRTAYPRRNSHLTDVRISICDVRMSFANESAATVKLQLPALQPPGYLTQARWVDDRTLAVTVMSRNLTSGHVIHCKAPSWGCHQVYSAAGRRWVSPLRPVFAADRADFVVKTDNSEALGRQMVKVLVREEVKIRHEVAGHRILEVQHWDIQRHEILYTAVQDSQPSEVHLYSRKDSSSPRAASQCLTCHLSLLLGRHCSSFRAFMDGPSGSVGVECSDGVRRTLHLLDRNFTRQLTLLDTDEKLLKSMADLAIPLVQEEMVQLGQDYIRLEMVLPALWDEKKGGTYRFPFVLNFEDDDRDPEWSRSFATLMVSKWDLVFIRVKRVVWRSERRIYDDGKRTSEIIEYLKVRHPHLDLDHAAVLGEGFGGHTALAALAERRSIRCGAVASPVVDLNLYDAYHAERYKDTSHVLDLVEKLEDHSMYLIYGTKDPLAVHGSLLSRRLVERGVLFFQQVYIDEDIYLRSVRSHLLGSLENFFTERCFPHLIAKPEEVE